MATIGKEQGLSSGLDRETRLFFTKLQLVSVGLDDAGGLGG
jgi:hypothetical protein